MPIPEFKDMGECIRWVRRDMPDAPHDQRIAICMSKMGKKSKGDKECKGKETK